MAKEKRDIYVCLKNPPPLAGNVTHIYRYLIPHIYDAYIFHLATLFAGRELKIRIRQHDWLKLLSEKIRCEQVGTVPTFFCLRVQSFQLESMLFR